MGVVVLIVKQPPINRIYYKYISGHPIYLHYKSPHDATFIPVFETVPACSIYLMKDVNKSAVSSGVSSHRCTLSFVCALWRRPNKICTLHSGHLLCLTAYYGARVAA